LFIEEVKPKRKLKRRERARTNDDRRERRNRVE
jgi:hypothetical protein